MLGSGSIPSTPTAAATPTPTPTPTPIPTPTPTPTPSTVSHQQFQILNVLKNKKATPYSLQELESALKFPILQNKELLESLKKNDNIQFVSQTEVQFQETYFFKDSSGLLNYLKEKKRLHLDIEIESLYPGIKEDIQKLVKQRLILEVRAFKKQQDRALFFNDVVWERADERLRKKLLSISLPDIVDIRNSLTKDKIQLACIEFQNEPVIISKKKKERKRKKKEYKRTKRREDLLNIELPEDLQFGGLDEDSADEEDNEPEEVAEVEEKAEKKITPANLVRLIQILGRSLFIDECIVVFDAVALQGPTKDTNLAREYNLANDQIRGPLYTLQNRDKLVKHIDVLEGDGTKRRAGLWFIDFNEVVDITNYRLHKFQTILTEELKKLEEEVSKCIFCDKTYTINDGHLLMNEQCFYCQKPLKEIDNKNEIQDRKTLQNLYQTQLAPLAAELESFVKQQHLGEVSIAAQKVAATSQNLQPTSARKPPSSRKNPPSKTPNKSSTLSTSKSQLSNNVSSGNVTSTPKHTAPPVTPSSTTSITSKSERINNFASTTLVPTYTEQPIQLFKGQTTQTPTNSNQFVSEKTESKAKEDHQSALLTELKQFAQKGELSERPIEYLNSKLYLTLTNKTAKFKWSPLEELAHKFLVSIGDMKIYYSQIFEFELTHLSIYLAKCHGKSIEEILTYCRLLVRGMNAAAIDSLSLLHAQPYFKVFIALRNEKFYVETVSLQDAEQLSKFSIIKRQIFQQSNGLYVFEITSEETESLRRLAYQCGFPTIDRYEYITDTSVTPLKITLKNPPDRQYQLQATEQLFWDNQCHSGILVLPCGAGKTNVGISVITKLQRAALIFCTNTMAAKQWRDQLLKWCRIDSKQICKFTSASRKEWNADAGIIITTYSMFASSSTARSVDSAKMIEKCKRRIWGTLVLDEVHLAPADTFRKVTSEFKSHVKLGLTATMIREDSLIEDLPYLVGPKVYEVDILFLISKGYISNINCNEISVPMTAQFGGAYKYAVAPEKRRLMYITNPNKIQVINQLVSSHLAKNHKVMVFCDDLFGLEWFSKVLKKEYVDGSTPTDVREQIIHNFRTKPGGDYILLSKIGDISIDLPEANVLVQIGIVDGSRMQEAQRVGRIQRFSAQKGEGYFYSLISDGTVEVEFAKKRRSWMEEHGYKFRDREFLEFAKQTVSEAFEEDLLRAIDTELLKRENKNNGTAVIPAFPNQKKSVPKTNAYTRLEKVLKK